MKKILSIILATTLILSASIVAQAGQIPKVNLNEIKLLLQNSPFIENGRTYIPLRSVSENLGCEVSWNQENKTATIIQDQNKIEMSIGSMMTKVNNKVIEIDAAAQLVNGITYVPVRFISEVLGATVNYTKDTNTIDITYDMPKDENAQYDYWGRKIRTTNLPAKADSYEYILECVPNEVYDTPLAYVEELASGNWIYTWTNEDGTKGSRLPEYGVDYWSPADDNKYSMYAKFLEKNDRKGSIWEEANKELDKELREISRDGAEKYMDLLLNVDYKTVDDKWLNDILATNIDSNSARVEGYGYYAQNIKDNKITLIGDYYFEPSITYVGKGGYMRGWLKFKAESDIADSFCFGICGNNDDYKTNTWYQGYVDIPFGVAALGDIGKTAKPTAFFLTNIEEIK